MTDWKELNQQIMEPWSRSCNVCSTKDIHCMEEISRTPSSFKKNLSISNPAKTHKKSDLRSGASIMIGLECLNDSIHLTKHYRMWYLYTWRYESYTCHIALHLPGTPSHKRTVERENISTGLTRLGIHTRTLADVIPGPKMTHLQIRNENYRRFFHQDYPHFFQSTY